MADYYFCNGTTRRNLPCQNRVLSEGGRCHHHNTRSEEGLSAREYALKVYDSLKSATEIYNVAKTTAEIAAALGTLSFSLAKALEFAGCVGASADNASVALSEKKTDIILRITEMNEQEQQRLAVFLTIVDMEAFDAQAQLSSKAPIKGRAKKQDDGEASV